jgi:hypothetical protein
MRKASLPCKHTCAGGCSASSCAAACRPDARTMMQWQHGGGFSVDGSVRIAATDRAGRERLLRYCAKATFVLERL